MRKINLQSPARTVLIYPNEASFLRHAQKHVLAAGEDQCWAYVLKNDAPHWRAVEQAEPGAPWSEAVAKAYEECADAMAKGIAFAHETPAYLETTERILGHDREVVRTSRMFVGKEGFIVCEGRGAIRTAYFPGSGEKGRPSRWELFRAALASLRARYMAVQSRQQRYLPEENRWSIGVEATRHAQGNFSNRINPWPQPAGVSKRARNLKNRRDAYGEYLEKRKQQGIPLSPL